MQNNVSNISFKSNIRFVNYKDYRKIAEPAGTNLDSAMFDLAQIRKINDSDGTERIIYCVAGVLNNIADNTKSLFHWCPDYLFKRPTLKEDYNLLAIGERIQEMKKTSDLNGLVIGGLAEESEPQRATLSSKLFKYLKEQFSPEERKKFTTFFAQKLETNDTNCAFAYSKNNDTYYINCKSQDLLSKEELRNHFKYINIADNDKVFVGKDSQDIISNSFWNKNELKDNQ